MMLEAIVAVYADWGIGTGGTQPVVVRADRRRFAELTDGSAIIVGRKTLMDFPGGKPLKNRWNLVLTRCREPIEGARLVHSVEEALTMSRNYERAFVIGGESVYRQMLPYIERVHVTKIDCTPESSSFFENLDASPDWEIVDQEEAMEQDGLGYRFVTYQKRAAHD